jgi:hypothetical protein
LSYFEFPSTFTALLWLQIIFKWSNILTGGQLIEFHLIFSVDRKFLLNLAFDRMHFFVTWSKVSLIFDKFWQLIKTFINYFHLIKSLNNGILSYFKLFSTAKNPSVLFWQLVKSSNNGILCFLSTFDQVPKSVGSFLAVDRMYCWLRNRTKN